MNNDINFRNIRSHDSSKNKGFEELCCQLASLEPPEEDAQWIRKEGSGGDAGVEAYWRTQSGQEHCWQVKYLFELGTSQWRQIDESVKTALEKHTSMVRYVVCLPIDLTEQREPDQISQRKKWDKKVAEWQKLKPNRNVSFEFWGAHEISNRLMQKKEQNSGRILYWFAQDCLTQSWIRERFEEARANLGPRYTPELNVDLPISRAFEGLAHTKQFRETALARWKKSAVFSSDTQLRDIIAQIEDVRQSITKTLRKSSANISFSQQCNKLEKIHSNLRNIENDYRERGPERDIMRNIRHLLDDTSTNQYLFSEETDVLAAEGNTLFLTGNAGTGKSHLFADIADRFTQDGLPVILLLGQQFTQGDPWPQILQRLDFQGNIEGFLGALNTAAQAKSVRALIMIDALNEGNGQHIWPNHLAGLITRIRNYPYIALAISCRTTYERRIIPDESFRNTLLRIEHRGFEGHEDEAAQAYLDQQGIIRPSAPFFMPELSNPLFLKMLCDSLNRQGQGTIPVGLRGINQIFEFYVNSLETAIETQCGLDEHQNLVRQAINSIIQEMSQSQKAYVEKSRIIKFFDRIVPSQGSAKKSLLSALLDENFISEDWIHPNENNQGVEIIRFTFERFSDHFRAKYILDQYPRARQLKMACTPNEQNWSFKKIWQTTLKFFKIQEQGKIFNLLKTNHYGCEGLMEALSIQIPEKYNKEFLNFISNEKNSPLIYYMTSAFQNSLLWRNPESINENTVYWINREFPAGFGNTGLLDVLIRTSTDPAHKLNAYTLHKKLKRFSLAERDALWSVGISKLWSVEAEETQNAIHTLIDWAWHADMQNTDNDRIELASITLAWCLSSPNRELRDRTTKALTSLLKNRVQLTRKLLLCFDPIDDLYIRERIYAVAYGVAMHLNDAEGCARLARTVYNRIFRNEKPPAHILLRDYARGIIEKAASMGVLSKWICLENVRPPYKSDWPLVDPGVETIESITPDELGRAKYSVMVDDFGIYVMNDVFRFSATPRSEGEPKSWSDLVLSFLNELKDSPESMESAKKAIEEGYHGLWGDQDKAPLHLSPDEKEKCRWLQLGDKSAIFSRRLAKRWIVNRVKEMGWTKDRFADFESHYSGHAGRSPATVERMGKKYQWIAYHELLARMADNLHYFDNHNKEPEIFRGPWQEFLRDIDPSYLADDTRKPKANINNWWRPHINEISSDMSLEQIHSWIKERGDLPDIKDLIQIKELEKDKDWFVLQSFLKEEVEHEADWYYNPEKKPWGQIIISTQALFLEAEEAQNIINKWKGEDIRGDIESRNGIGGNNNQAFIGEYNWHQAWYNPQKNPEKLFLQNSHYGDSSVNGHIPLHEYGWDQGQDKSLINHINIKLPSPFLCSGLQLNPHDIINPTFETNFLYHSAGSEYSAMVKKIELLEWLEKKDLDIVWNVNIYKTCHGLKDEDFIGNLIDCATVFYQDQRLAGQRWVLFESIGPLLEIISGPSDIKN